MKDLDWKSDVSHVMIYDKIEGEKQKDKHWKRKRKKKKNLHASFYILLFTTTQQHNLNAIYSPSLASDGPITYTWQKKRENEWFETKIWCQLRKLKYFIQYGNQKNKQE